MFKKNTKGYKVLTPNGYEIFDGMNKIHEYEYAIIKFENHDLIKCSTKHPFIDVNGNMIKAKDLLNHKIKTVNGYTQLQYKKIVYQEIDLYDIVNSGSDHIYYTNGVLSHNCSFLGSAGTLIDGTVLEKLSYIEPVRETSTDYATVKFYEEPKDDRVYVCLVDTAEGTENDSSVINIIDITTAPYKQVFIYKDNKIQPLLFGDVVAEIAKKYNDAYIVIENNNSSGAMVSNYLWYDVEYENMLSSKVNIKDDSETSVGFDGSKSVPGIRTTKKTKAIGCSYLKNLIETNKIIITDFDTITELSTFIKVGKSYEAEKGKHDDIVMTLVLFSWFTTQEFFEDLTNIKSKKMLNDALKEDDGYMAVLGFISNGIDDYKENNTFNLNNRVVNYNINYSNFK